MATNNTINRSSYSLTTDTGITATTGNITATLGDVVITNGKLSVGGVTGTSGQVLIAATSANPAWATISAGSGISITPGANTLSIASTGGGFTWVPVSTDGSFVVNQGVINTKTTLLSMSLPAVAAVGSVIAIQGLGAGGWKITQGALQQVIVNENIYGVKSTTIGIAGYVGSDDVNDGVSLVCVVANTTWTAYSILGYPNVV